MLGEEGEDLDRGNFPMRNYSEIIISDREGGVGNI